MGIPVIERVSIDRADTDYVWVKIAGRETIKVAKKRLFDYHRFQNVLRHRFGAEYESIAQEVWERIIEAAMRRATP
jgi:hypothetical protein